MKFKVLSRRKIKNFITDENHIVISVRDPNSEHAELPKLKSRLSVLDLEFSDLDGVHLPSNEFYILFDDSMAKNILTNVIRYKKEVDLIICQCEAGISRSAGIAAALSEILNDDCGDYFNKFIPNMLVYRTILERYFEDLK